MVYYEVLEVLSSCRIGAVMATQNDMVVDMNTYGAKLLGNPDMKIFVGFRLKDTAPFLLSKDYRGYSMVDFDTYIRLCPPPYVDNLPVGLRLITFYDASIEVHNLILKEIYYHVSDAITVWDSECRMLSLNDVAAIMEGHVIDNIRGKHNMELYNVKDDSSLAITQVIKTQKPQLKKRIDFKMKKTGKELSTISNNYPVMHDGNILAAFCVVEDNRKLQEMKRRTAEIQKMLSDPQEDPGRAKKNLLTARYHFSDIIYCSEVMKKVLEQCKMFARSDFSVLIYGETGTGKELFAQSIHNASNRSSGPFVAINCAAIPEALLESMLFGSVKGAYTGAQDREGLLEQANGGTLLLDEINSMPIGLQSKLLRFLQEGTFRKVGDSKTIKVDVRIISNINVEPMQAIKEQNLRQDLYYRLGVINITIPPLSQRKDDIPLLVKNFIMKNRENGGLQKNVTDIDPKCLEIFDLYSWPGNVRELQHAIEHAVALIPENEQNITEKYLPEYITHNTLIHTQDSEEKPQAEAGRERAVSSIPVKDYILDTAMEEVLFKTAQNYLVMVLESTGGNITKAADAMGISRQKMQYRLKKYDIDAQEISYLCRKKKKNMRREE